jgi:hypothetical protein
MCRVVHSSWITLKMQAPTSSATLVTMYQSQWHNILEDLTLHDEFHIPTQTSNLLLLTL